MAGVTYKCPSCGAYLTFDPDAQAWKCPFCESSFAENELLEKAETYQQQAEAQATQQQPAEATSGQQVAYHCPSCGSEVITDETTVATHCYYCHNPVVLQGKLTADMKPDMVLPFTIGKEKAVERFMKWVHGKRFVPKSFFNQAQVELMSGVYYPHFVNKCVVDGRFSGEGTNTSVADVGRYIITSTKHYRVVREGRLTFHNIMRPALQKANRKLSDGIHPFPLDQSKPFSGAYLTGFLAERRDIDSASVEKDVENEVERYVEPMLTSDLPYSNHRGDTSVKLQSFESQYVLLPTWVLTYPNKENKDDPYYYVMNGCTGEVCGKLPLNRSKLWGAGLAIGAGVFIVCSILSYLFF